MYQFPSIVSRDLFFSDFFSLLLLRWGLWYEPQGDGVEVGLYYST